MDNMLLTQAIILAMIVLILGILIYILVKSNKYTISQTKFIKQTPEKIFPYINNFKSWHDWASWEDIDPNITRIYSDNPKGVGATYEWISKQPNMHGKMTITETMPSNKILIKIDFIKPARGSNTIEFDLKNFGEGTLVTQSMCGKHTFAARLMNVFSTIDKSIEKQYDKGLSKLKKLVE